MLILGLDRLCERARREHLALDLNSWLAEPDPMIAVGVTGLLPGAAQARTAVA